MTTSRNHGTVAAQAQEWRYKVQAETLGAPTTEHDFGFWDDARVAAFAESRETVESKEGETNGKFSRNDASGVD